MHTPEIKIEWMDDERIRKNAKKCCEILNLQL